MLGRLPQRPKHRSDVDWRLSNIVAGLVPFLREPQLQEALEVLRRDFQQATDVGSRVVATQVSGGPNEQLAAKVVQMVREFLDEVARQLPVEGEA